MGVSHQRRRIAAVVLAALALAVPAAATPHGAGSTAASRPALPALPTGSLAATVVDGEIIHAPRSAQEALLAVRDHRDLGAWLGSIAEAIRLTGGMEAVGAVSPDRADLADDDDEDFGGDGPEGRGSVASSIRAGDLDGDGHEDVLVADYDLSSGAVRLRAVRGLDARPIWEQPFSGDGAIAFPTGADLDGDGVADLLSMRFRSRAISFERSEEDTVLARRVEEAYREDFTWTIGVVSGSDGAPLWTRDVDGHIDERYTSDDRTVEEEGTYQVDATALWILPLLLADGEVGVETIDLAIDDRYGRQGLYVAGAEQFDLRLRGTTRLVVVDGADGQLTRELVDGPAAALTFIVPFGGEQADALLVDRWLVGDERYDCTSAVLLQDCTVTAGEMGTEVGVVDARTFDVRWTHHDPDGIGINLVLDADMTGDGQPEILVLGWGEDGEEPFVSTLLSSEDGAEVWQLTDAGDWLWPVVVGDLGGAAGADLAALALEVDEEGVVVRLDRRDGTDGSLLLSTSHRIPWGDESEDTDPSALLGGSGSSSFIGLYAGPLDDVDADGVQDVLVGHVRYVYRYTPTTAEEEESWGARVESTRTGDELYADGGDGFAFLSPLADVTGDGIPEVLFSIAGEDWFTYTDEIVSLQSGDVLWTAPEGFLADGGDQDGAPGSELLHVATDWGDEHEEPEAHDVSSTVSSLVGATGAVRWSLFSQADSGWGS